MASPKEREQELNRIFNRDGCVRPSTVVKEAAPAKAPLHKEFEWNDKVAGHEYRLSQARRLIRITFIRDATGTTSRFVHVPVVRVDGPTAVDQDHEGVYKPIVHVVREPDDYKKALYALMSQRDAMDRAIRELQRAARKANRDEPLLPALIECFASARSILRKMSTATETTPV